MSDDFEQNPIDHAGAATPQLAEKDVESVGERADEKGDNISETNGQTHETNRDSIKVLFEHPSDSSETLEGDMSQEDPFEDLTQYLDADQNHSETLEGDMSHENTLVGLTQYLEADQHQAEGRETKNNSQLDQTILELKELNEDTEKADPKPQRESNLVREKLSLVNIVLNFDKLRKGNVPELNVALKMYKKKEIDGKNISQTEGSDGLGMDKNKVETQNTDIENEEVGKNVEDLNEEEIRMKLLKFLDKLREYHKAVKNQSKSNIYNPPGNFA